MQNEQAGAASSPDQQPQTERCRSLFPIFGILGRTGVFAQCDLGKGHAKSHRHGDQCWHDETDGAMMLSFPVRPIVGATWAPRSDTAEAKWGPWIPGPNAPADKIPPAGFVTGERIEGHTTKGLCAHKVVTVTEDGGRCNACGADLEYNPVSRNWIPVWVYASQGLWTTAPTEDDRVRGFGRCNHVARIPSLSSEPLRCIFGRGHSGGHQFSPDYPDSNPEPLNPGPLPETIADKEPTKPVNLYPVGIKLSGSIQECVMEAIGIASMCWEHPYRGGVFQSERAQLVGEALLERIYDAMGSQQSDLVDGLKRQIELGNEARRKGRILLQERGRQCEELNKKAAELEKELEQSKVELGRAVVSLLAAGWTHEAGAERWKPPINIAAANLNELSKKYDALTDAFKARKNVSERLERENGKLHEDRNRVLREVSEYRAINEQLRKQRDSAQRDSEKLAAEIAALQARHGEGGPMGHSVHTVSGVHPGMAVASHPPGAAAFDAEMATVETLPQPGMLGLATDWLDHETITPHNIGAVRSRLLMPFECEWNGWVLDETAKRERKPADQSGPGSEPDETQHTPCCNYPFRQNPQQGSGPIFWNGLNKVVQCHNCGQVFQSTAAGRVG